MLNFGTTYHPRGYRHLDNHITREAAGFLATSPTNVTRHAFYPLIRREIKIQKYSHKLKRKSEKSRVIYYASHADSAIYSWYAAILSEKYEERLKSSSFNSSPLAYRRFENKKCNIHFAKDAFSFIRQNRPCVVFCLDVEGFFDNLCHELILDAWKDILGVERLPEDHWKVYKNLTAYCWFEEELLREKHGPLSRRRNKVARRKSKSHSSNIVERRSKPPKRFCVPEDLRHLRKLGHLKRHDKKWGIPQGNPMSAVLSNIYMMAFDKEISSYVSAVGGFYRRYSDDIIIAVPKRHSDGVQFTVERAIAKRKLKLHSTKTESAIFGKSGKCDKLHIQYLGFTYDGISIRLRPQTLNRANSRVHRHLFNSHLAAAANEAYPHLYTRKFYTRFSSKGKRNFIFYGKRCAEILECPAIVKQVQRHKKRNLNLLRNAQSPKKPRTKKPHPYQMALPEIEL